MKPRFKVEWDINGRKKEMSYVNSRLESRHSREAMVSKERAHKLKNIGSHLVSKKTLGGRSANVNRQYRP